jgi:hypothetical protein
MTDIYDLKNIFFGFIYSYKYFIIIFSLVFIIFYYLLLNKFFKKAEIIVEKKEFEVKKEVIENGELKNRLIELERDIKTLPREIFYNEILNILKGFTYKNFNDENIYTFTLKEIKENYNLEYFYILKESYFHQFDESLEDNIETRKHIIEETKKVL